jgi:hypothetical protein
VVQLETEQFPLVLLDLGGSDRTPDEVRATFAGFHPIHRRARAEGKRWALVAVTRSPPNAVERKILAEEANKFPREDQALIAVMVLVIPDGIIRSVVTALTWMLRVATPLAAAPTPTAAVDVAIERLRAIGLDVPQTEIAQAKRWLYATNPWPSWASRAVGRDRDEQLARPRSAGEDCGSARRGGSRSCTAADGT